MMKINELRLNPTTIAMLEELDAQLEIQRLSRPFPPQVAARIKTEFLPDRVTASLNIEGIAATKRQTLAMMDAMTLSDNSTKAEVEILNALKADELVYQEAQSEKALTPHFIREVNALILEGVESRTGSYRENNVEITGAAFQPPDHYEVPRLVREMITEFNGGDAQHPLVKAAWLHNTFTHIHPFLDGNGRTGRLLQDYTLLRSGYFPTGIPSYKRDSYYDALQSADDGNIDDLVQIIAESELTIISKVQSIIDDNKFRGKIISQLSKVVSAKKKDTQFKQYLVWKHRMQTMLNQLVSFTDDLNDASPEISIRNQPYDVIDFDKWRQLVQDGRAPQTWALSQVWGLDGLPIYRSLLYFGRHRFRPEDAHDKDELYGNVALFFTGVQADSEERFDFASFSDKDVPLREILYLGDDWTIYEGTGETSLTPQGYQREEWITKHTNDLTADVFMPLVVSILQSKGGIEFS